MSRRVVWFTWDERPTLTFRRHLPVWVGWVRPGGMYVRVGTHSCGFVLMPPLPGGATSDEP